MRTHAMQCIACMSTHYIWCMYLETYLYNVLMSLLGALESLLPYETGRQRHVVAVIAAINVLHKLFSTSMTPIVLARTLGLQATNSFNPVKVILFVKLLKLHMNY